jgi:hypothetical protein
VAHGEITLQKLKLFRGRPRFANIYNKIAVTLEKPLLGGRWLELVGHHTDRNAGGAINATGPIGHRLAAPKTDPAKRIVQLAPIRAFQFGKDLPFAPARKIGARRGAGDEKSRETNGRSHGLAVASIRRTIRLVSNNNAPANPFVKAPLTMPSRGFCAQSDTDPGIFRDKALPVQIQDTRSGKS